MSCRFAGRALATLFGSASAMPATLAKSPGKGGRQLFSVQCRPYTRECERAASAATSKSSRRGAWVVRGEPGARWAGAGYPRKAARVPAIEMANRRTVKIPISRRRIPESSNHSPFKLPESPKLNKSISPLVSILLYMNSHLEVLYILGGWTLGLLELLRASVPRRPHQIRLRERSGLTSAGLCGTT